MRTPRLRLTLEVTDENVSSGNKEVTVTLIAELDKATSNNTDLKIAIISQLDDAIMHLINTANKNSNGEIITANRYNNGEIRQDGLHIMVGLVFAITPSRPSTTIDNPNTAVKWAMIVEGNEVQDWEEILRATILDFHNWTLQRRFGEKRLKWRCEHIIAQFAWS